MCTFLNTLPKKSKTAGTAKRKSLVLSIKPCPDQNGEKTWYRFRLLNFAGQGTDRDYPFIERYIHQKWRVNEKGYPEIEDEVVCPVTKWVEWEGNRYESCPVCRYANQQFVTLKESNWKDADARRKNRDFSRKFQGIVPVYVVSDPNYEGNNGKFKVIMFGDKKQYDAFVKKVEAQLLKANCFNGVNAVDCCIHMSEVPEVRNEGQPNEYVYKNKVIDKILFANKPKDLPAITKQAVDNFPFDATYYTSSTPEEIQAFYNKYIKVSNDDIVDDEDEVKVFDSPKVEKKPEQPQTTVNENMTEDDDISDEDIESLTVDDEVAASSKPIDTDELDNAVADAQPNAGSSDDASDSEVEDLLKGLDID